MRALVAVAFFAVVIHANAAAQQSTIAPPAEAQTQAAGWVFRPSIGAGGAWDDNVLLLGPGAAPPSDYLTSVTPAGLLDYRGRRLSFNSGYYGSFVFYRDLSELNFVDQNGTATLKYRVTPFVTVFGGQSYASSPATDGLEFAGIPFRRIGNRRSATQGGIEIRFSPRTTFNAGYDLRFVDFDDDVVLTFPGGHEHAASGTLRYQLSPRVTIGGTGGMRRALVVDDPAPIMIYNGAGITEYRITENIQIGGNLGVSHVGTVGEQPAQTGLAFRGEISASRQLFTATAYYERSMIPTFGFGGTLQNEEFAGVVQGAFSRNRAFWQGTAAWRENDPLVIVADPILEPSRRQLWLQGKLGYRLSDWLSVEGYYIQAREDAQRPGGKVTRSRVGFQVVTTKALRLGH
jgi:hypothetical protein